MHRAMGIVHQHLLVVRQCHLHASHIAKWDSAEQQWQALGSGVDGLTLNMATDSSDNVYAAGLFTTAGDTEASNIAKRSYSTQNWEAVGSQISSPVYALAVDRDVFVGGGFTTVKGGKGISGYDIPVYIRLWYQVNGITWMNNTLPLLVDGAAVLATDSKHHL